MVMNRYFDGDNNRVVDQEGTLDTDLSTDWVEPENPFAESAGGTDTSAEGTPQDDTSSPDPASQGDNAVLAELKKVHDSIGYLQRRVRRMERNGIQVPDEIREGLRELQERPIREAEAQALDRMTDSERADYWEKKAKGENPTLPGVPARQPKGQAAPADRYSERVTGYLEDYFDDHVSTEILRLASVAGVTITPDELDVIRGYAVKGSSDGSYKGVTVKRTPEGNLVDWQEFLTNEVDPWLKERREKSNTGNSGNNLGGTTQSGARARGDRGQTTTPPRNGNGNPPSPAANAGRALGDTIRPNGNGPQRPDPQTASDDELWDFGVQQRRAASRRS